MSIKMKRGGIMSLEGVEKTPVGEVDPAAAAIAATPAEGTPLDDTTGGAKGTAEEKVIAAPDTGEELQTTPESAVADANAIEPAASEAEIAKIVEEVAPSEPTVESSLVAMEGAVEGVIELDDSVQEAVQVIETVEGINEQLEVAASEEGEGLTPQEAEPIRLAVEGMKLRVGYQSEKSVFPAMESFGGKTTKREGAKLALESNRKFVADLKVGVRYAREGMTDKLGEAWGLVFATNDKILARLEEVDGAFSKGEVGSEPIVKPTWGQTLNPESKPTVGAADVISLLQGLADAGESAKLVDGIRAGTEWIKGGCEETGAAGVQEQAEGTEQVVDNAMSEAQASAGEEGDFEPCTAENKDTIVSLIKGLLDTSALKEANDALQAAMGEGECAGADKVLDMVKAGLELHARTAVVASAAVAYLATSVREGASEEAAPAGDETQPAPASTEETTPADGGEAAAADDKKPEEEGKTE